VVAGVVGVVGVVLVGVVVVGVVGVVLVLVGVVGVVGVVVVVVDGLGTAWHCWTARLVTWLACWSRSWRSVGLRPLGRLATSLASVCVAPRTVSQCPALSAEEI
jgi:hypothetical protein